MEKSMPSNAPKKALEMSNDEIDDHIYNAIVDAILNRQLAPGARLVEAPLCEAFGVTRGVLRRVFVKLAHDKVIEIQPNRGALIAKHSVHETKEVFEARSMLEIATVKKLAQKSHRLDFSELRTLVEQESDERLAGNWAEWIKLSGQFHLKLVEANQNSIMTSYLQTLIARTSLLIGLYEIPKHNNCSADEHRAILDAIEQGDEKRATQLMEEHLENYATTFIEENSTVSAEQNLLNLFKNKRIETTQTN
ncbi:TPA: GntR family transcriptional regulator [Acinetobacter baumannii]|uniref:GntR family transcriptional regulator n=1 Tax=Acinetobacter baumannii TaxID=470 RepID=UPI000D671E51|nr:GntR family transcriptional regulator [Acinetobacter baumannii]EKU0660544.1 GntR family transcriptional regulator [Acinetobacter baumannii]EKU2443139.1 GntR family transcriptional regulator [Acinetobacter baumannii]EKU2730742.1 GntR family transcriptional regulator [Acinetobacter baumannii]EKU5230552.1 GntR family transcriptional regulator [Acinetobacter baumannii]EKU5654781.1 GntR family transcriptional regulator [Acinetobacter baumannii]